MGFLRTYISSVGKTWLTLMAAFLGVILVVAAGLITGAGMPRWAWAVAILVALAVAEGVALWRCWSRSSGDPPAPSPAAPVIVHGDSRWVVALPGSVVNLPPAAVPPQDRDSGTIASTE